MNKTEVINLLNSVDKTKISHFCRESGAREVHRSWRDNMLLQNRNISEERLNWKTLSEIDKELDARISEDVIWDFLIWAMSHPH